MKKPVQRTTVPGPKALEWISRDAKILSPSLPREYPLVAVRGNGQWIEDIDGNEYLDFTSGIAVCNTGHCHPKIVEAIQRQAANLIHMCGSDFYHLPMIRFAERLAAITPGDFEKRVLLANSGAEAVEAGFKLARWHSGRDKAIAFLGAFHGRTMGALSLTASKAVQRKGFSSFVPGIHHVPYAHCYRCAFRLTYPACDFECIRFIEAHLFRTILPAEEVAVIVIEPIQGEGGYVVPPAGYHERLKRLAETYGILYMTDEIQSGMGRTGKLFAMEHFGVAADIVTMAKGIASGMPLSALVARAEVMNWTRGAHGSTYGGNPIACEAAIASLDVIQSGLIDNARVLGERLRAGLDALASRYECMGDVRGLGLMQAVEFVDDRIRKNPDKTLRDAVLQGCFQKGLLLLSCGESVIRFCPPLIVSAGDIDVALDIYESVLKSLRS
ncbi:acetyl ornithine aminotransferase family protein [Desulfatirhabdium butyrativorans]|uniref:acetyl ornithine aminotransferase family protein n=1 Tax=Desulfatirhabdium butyrativorans TaxID=340467 RepID=UPI0003FBE67E|nr:acetyl ornithine aminotransferase family protein [Desulfatirhabdium butyrativorans]